MKMCQSWSYLWLPLIIALLLSGCFNQSPNISLYLLSPLPPKSTLTTKNGPFNAMTIVMPVRLAPQLNQTGMFVRVTPERSHISTHHLWSAPLEKQITETLSANLSRQLHTASFTIYPGPRFGNFVYSVEVDIQDFSPFGEKFTIQAVWTINSLPQKSILKRAAFSKTLDSPQQDYDGYVKSASDAVSQLSQEIADALRAIDNSILQDKVQ